MKTILAIPIFFLLIGCSSLTPRELLSKIYSVPEKEISISTKDVIKNIDSKPLGAFTSTDNVIRRIDLKPIGGFISSEIEISDPILLYGDSVKYRSNYKLYYFMAKENQKYNIEVTSYFKNAGMGFNKYAMAPLVFLLDAEGNIVDKSPKKFDVSTLLSYYLVVNYDGVIKKSDKYFLLIGSDNRAAGRTFLIFMQDFFNQYTYGSIPMDLNGYPIGSFDLKIFLE